MTKHENDLNDILKKAQFCRDWRNRRIAHTDYKLSANLPNVTPLEPATKEKLTLVITKIQELYNKISNDYLNDATIFSLNVTGTTTLLRTIESGLRFDEEVKKRMTEGTWADESFKSRV